MSRSENSVDDGTASPQPAEDPQPFGTWDQQAMASLARRANLSPSEAVALVERYLAALDVPLGDPFLRKPGQWFRTGMWGHSSGWLPATKQNGSSTHLCRAHVANHLCGDFAVAVERAHSRVVAIDLDVHGADDGETLLRRAEAVRVALSRPPCLPIRSSKSGGLHLLLWLDRQHPARDVHARVDGALRRGGIDVRPGQVEAFPAPGRALRLPLGSGSILLDDDYMPMLGSRTRSGVWRADLVASIEAVCAASRATFTLESLIGPTEPAPRAFRLHPRDSSLRSSHSSRESFGDEKGTALDPVVGEGWGAECRAIEREGIASYGTRYDMARKLVFHLHKVVGREEVSRLWRFSWSETVRRGRVCART